MAFDLTGRLTILPPSNLGQVKNQIQSQLAGTRVTIDVTLNPRASQGVKDLNNQINSLNSGLNNARNTATQTAASLDRVSQSARTAAAANTQLRTSVSGVGSNVTTMARGFDEAANSTENFARQAGLAARRFIAFSVAAGAIIKLTSAIRSGLGEAISFQRELVRIAQLGPTTREEIAGIANEVSRLAVNLGVSSAELLTTARTFKQAGLSATETKQALEAMANAALAPNFGDLQNTVEGAIAAMRQFNIPASQLIDTMGSINAVAGQFAVEAEDITSAIQRTGGAFVQTGGSLNELIALFTSVRATTRESAESISTGLRTIFARLQRPETVESLRDLGISIRRTREEALALGDVNLTDQFVGGYEAIRRIAAGLRNIPTTDPRFASAVEQIGGFRQVSRVIPLIREFGTSQRALNIAQGGSASLTRSTTVAQEALEVQLTKLTERFKALFREITNSASFQVLAKAFITFGNSVAFLVEQLKPLIPLLATFAATKLVSGALTSIRGFSSTFFAGPTTRSSDQFNRPSPRGFARGGPVSGVGNGDTVPAMLEPGEFVLRKSAVQNIGVSNLHRVNTNPQRFATGGYVAADTNYTPGLFYLQETGAAKRVLARVNKKSLNPTSAAARILTGDISSANSRDFREVKAVRDDIRNRNADDVRSIAVQTGVLNPKSNRITNSFYLKNANATQKNLYNPSLPVLRQALVGQKILQVQEDYAKRAVNTKLAKSNIDEIAGFTVPVDLFPVAKKSRGAFEKSFDENIGNFIQSAYSFAGLPSSVAGGSITKDEVKTIADKAITQQGKGRLFESLILALSPKQAKQSNETFDLNPPLGKTISNLFAANPNIYADVKIANNEGNIKSVAGKAIRQFGIKTKGNRFAFEDEAKFGAMRKLAQFNRGGAATDRVPALLTPGEFIINRPAAQSIGINNLRQANQTGDGRFLGFAKGGLVPGYVDGGVITNAKNDVKKFIGEIATVGKDILSFIGRGLSAVKQGLATSVSTIAPTSSKVAVGALTQLKTGVGKLLGLSPEDAKSTGQYRVQAMDTIGRESSFNISAKSKDEAFNQVRQQGQFPYDIQEEDASLRRRAARLFFPQEQVSSSTVKPSISPVQPPRKPPNTTLASPPPDPIPQKNVLPSIFNSPAKPERRSSPDTILTEEETERLRFEKQFKDNLAITREQRRTERQAQLGRVVRNRALSESLGGKVQVTNINDLVNKETNKFITSKGFSSIQQAETVLGTGGINAVRGNAINNVQKQLIDQQAALIRATAKGVTQQEALTIAEGRVSAEMSKLGGSSKDLSNIVVNAKGQIAGFEDSIVEGIKSGVTPPGRILGGNRGLLGRVSDSITGRNLSPQQQESRQRAFQFASIGLSSALPLLQQAIVPNLSAENAIQTRIGTDRFVNSQTLSGTLTGASVGAAVGGAFGPQGFAIGAVGGAIIGAASAFTEATESIRKAKLDLLFAQLASSTESLLNALNQGRSVDFNRVNRQSGEAVAAINAQVTRQTGAAGEGGFEALLSNALRGIINVGARFGGATNEDFINAEREGNTALSFAGGNIRFGGLFLSPEQRQEQNRVERNRLVFERFGPTAENDRQLRTAQVLSSVGTDLSGEELRATIRRRLREPQFAGGIERANIVRLRGNVPSNERDAAEELARTRELEEFAAIQQAVARNTQVTNAALGSLSNRLVSLAKNFDDLALSASEITLQGDTLNTVLNTRNAVNFGSGELGAVGSQGFSRRANQALDTFRFGVDNPLRLNVNALQQIQSFARGTGNIELGQGERAGDAFFRAAIENLGISQTSTDEQDRTTIAVLNSIRDRITSQAESQGDLGRRLFSANTAAFAGQALQEVGQVTTDPLNAANRGLLDSLNRLSDNINRLDQSQRQLVSIQQRSLELGSESTRTRLRFQLGNEGRSSEFLRRTVGDSEREFSSAQNLLLRGTRGAGNGLDPQALARQLELTNEELRKNDITARSGRDGEERIRAVESLSRLTSESRRLEEALRNLSDPVRRNATLQERLNQLDSERQARLSIAERFITAGPGERARSLTDLNLARQLDARGQGISALGNVGAGRVLESLSRFQGLPEIDQLRTRLVERSAPGFVNAGNAERDDLQSRILTNLDAARQANDNLANVQRTAVKENTVAVENLTKQIQAAVPQSIIGGTRTTTITNADGTTREVNIPVRRASGGPIPNIFGNKIRKGTDSVPTLLTPGEFVINRRAAQNNRELVELINGSNGPVFSGGGPRLSLRTSGLSQNTPGGLAGLQTRQTGGFIHPLDRRNFAGGFSSASLLSVDQGSNSVIESLRRQQNNRPIVINPRLLNNRGFAGGNRSGGLLSIDQGAPIVFQTRAEGGSVDADSFERLRRLVNTATRDTSSARSDDARLIFNARRQLGLGRLTTEQVRERLVNLRSRINFIARPADSDRIAETQGIGLIEAQTQANAINQARANSIREAFGPTPQQRQAATAQQRQFVANVARIQAFRFASRNFNLRSAAGRTAGFSSLFGQSGFGAGGNQLLGQSNAARLAALNDPRNQAFRGFGFAFGQPSFTRVRPFANGGIVQGFGNTDSVPAVLTPGEAVLTRSEVQDANKGLRIVPNNSVSPAQSDNAGLERSLAGFNSSIATFNQAINKFNTITVTLAASIDNLPTSIQLEGRHTVDVNILGADVLSTIQPEIARLVEGRVRESLRQFVQDRMPDVGTV